MARHAAAIDIGGTFTDAVLLTAGGTAHVDKTLTTHEDLLVGFFRALDLVLARAGIEAHDLDDVVVHATTVVTNALIERKGPPAALVTTEGFRDVLLIRDEHRYDMYDPQIEYPAPLIPPENTFSVSERTFADGTVARAVSAEEVDGIIARCRAAGVRSVAVCLLNAYANPQNERALARHLAEHAPDLYVSLSSDVAPQMREYPRTSTTAINAFTRPITEPYLTALAEELARRGVRQEPLIMLSSGGLVGAATAARMPVRMIESGPAAGALVASHLARRHGLADLMSFDMGGTTAKACLIQGFSPLVSGHFEVDRRYRFKPGSGMPVTLPSIDMIEIGAGGGSIARVDALGLLKTGPDSAGSDPGPVSYGRGGTEPCVTDADLVLGILDAEAFLGGDMRLDVEAARGALARLGDGLGLSAEEAALGVFEVVCEQMAAAARSHATDRGVDYRGLPLLAFGGAGPVHACKVAELLDSGTVIYPALASVLSAFGTLVTPARIDLVRSDPRPLDRLDATALDAAYRAMEEEGRATLVDAGLPENLVRFSYAADMRYAGQQSEVTVAFERDPRMGLATGDMREAFERTYETQYGLRLSEMDVEVVTWRLIARGGTPDRDVRIALPETDGAPSGTRKVFLADAGWSDVPIYRRGSLAAGQTIAGPLIVEERETTSFILPGWRLSARTDGSLVAERPADVPNLRSSDARARETVQ